MQSIAAAIRQMIQVEDDEMAAFLALCRVQNFSKKAFLSLPDKTPEEVFFIQKGLVRVILIDRAGQEQTIHFALENQFIADYSSFILRHPAVSFLQAVEAVEAVVLPRKAIEWGYENLQQGDRLGRLIAEFYFIYQDDRIKNDYVRSPKARYDQIETIFPGIQNRVPQHMIASYLGITPVHLSRLKRTEKGKI